MKIPEQFVKENLGKARGMHLFGVPVEELSKDELIACLAMTSRALDNARQQVSKMRNIPLSNYELDA